MKARPTRKASRKKKSTRSPAKRAQSNTRRVRSKDREFREAMLDRFDELMRHDPKDGPLTEHDKWWDHIIPIASEAVFEVMKKHGY